MRFESATAALTAVTHLLGAAKLHAELHPSPRSQELAAETLRQFFTAFGLDPAEATEPPIAPRAQAEQRFARDRRPSPRGER